MTETTNTTSQSIETAMKQNPLLYVLIVLVLGGNGLDMFSSSGIREEVQRVAESVRQLSGRLDTSERTSADLLHEVEKIQSDLEELEGRIRAIERREVD